MLAVIANPQFPLLRIPLSLRPPRSQNFPGNAQGVITSTGTRSKTSIPARIIRGISNNMVSPDRAYRLSRSLPSSLSPCNTDLNTRTARTRCRKAMSRKATRWDCKAIGDRMSCLFPKQVMRQEAVHCIQPRHGRPTGSSLPPHAKVEHSVRCPGHPLPPASARTPLAPLPSERLRVSRPHRQQLPTLGGWRDHLLCQGGVIPRRLHHHPLCQGGVIPRRLRHHPLCQGGVIPRRLRHHPLYQGGRGAALLKTALPFRRRPTFAQPRSSPPRACCRSRKRGPEGRGF